MPPRIAYWTSTFEPEIEAIAAEVATLRRRFQPSVTWGLSQRHWLLLSRQRGFCLHPRLHLLFRMVTRLLEPAFDINHVFGSLGDWFYLQGVRRRPIVLTMAAHAAPVGKELLQRVERFVVEHPGGRDLLRELGVEAARVRLIFPPVDLVQFRPTPRPPGPFTVLFASSPHHETWLAARGVPLLLDAAALRPAVQFRLLWRPWGNGEAVVRRWVQERGLGNVEIVVGKWRDMASQYQRTHATIAPFTDLMQAKPAPNSLIESLACGRPVILTDRVGLAELIDEGKAGIVCPTDGQALAEAVDHLQGDWGRYSQNARRLAEKWFCRESFLEKYQQLYTELLDERATAPAWPLPALRAGSVSDGGCNPSLTLPARTE